MVNATQRDSEGRTLSSSNNPTAIAEIDKAIKEAVEDVSSIESVQDTTARLLLSALKADPPRHRVENTIEVILEEEDSIEQQ